VAEKRDTTVFDGIMSGLQEALAYAKGEETACKVTRVSDVVIEPIPDIGKLEVQTIRQSLNLSQKVFADVVGVSKKTVEAWENGRNKPEGAARRLIGMMAKNKSIVQEIVHTR